MKEFETLKIHDEAWALRRAMCRFAANSRWSKEKARKAFLVPVDLYNKNKYFKYRFDRAVAGLYHGYKIEEEEIKGTFKSIQAYRVYKPEAGASYFVRFFYKENSKRASGLASCTCRDFLDRGIKYRMPCKHVFMALLYKEVNEWCRYFPEVELLEV